MIDQQRIEAFKAIVESACAEYGVQLAVKLQVRLPGGLMDAEIAGIVPRIDLVLAPLAARPTEEGK